MIKVDQSYSKNYEEVTVKMNFKFYAALTIFLSHGIIFSEVNAFRIDITEKTSGKLQKFQYPKARRNESVVDFLHGMKVSDPYRWLENPDSMETKKFIATQNKFSKSFLSNDTVWSKIHKQLTLLWNTPKYGLPQHRGKYYFSTMNTGQQNQYNLYKQISLNEEPSILIDVNSFSSDGSVSYHSGTSSPDGSHLAYSLSTSGSDWIEIRVRNIDTIKDYPEVLKHVKFSGATWTHDNKGFFYCRFDPKKNADGINTEVNEYQKLYYHRVGESQDKDTLILEFPKQSTWTIWHTMSDDGKYLLITINEGKKRSMNYIDLEVHDEITEKMPLTKIESFGHGFTYIASTGSNMIFLAFNSLITVDIYNSSSENWAVLVQEDTPYVMVDAKCVDKDKLIVTYIHDVKSEIRAYDLETGEFIRMLSHDIGTIEQIDGLQSSSEVFFAMETFLTARTIYRYDFSTPDIKPSVYREIKLNLKGFDRNDFNVEQVFYPSDDGTKIPMYIVQKKTKEKGPKPVLLHGYGGFGTPITPSLNPFFLYFMNNFDGILAIANIRGGGEYGGRWYSAGRILKKQNSFTDFQAAAKYLVAQNYTEPKKIAIQGGSNGGLMIGACINQRPDLFGAAIAQVGVMDMLRFNKFTSGSIWTAEYGDLDNKTDFEYIRKYSPLHNVHAPNDADHQYPSTLITTGDNDDRVSPLHSLKFAATLQHELKNNEFQTNPILLKVYKNVGHSSGKSTSQKIEEVTDMVTFLYRSLHIDEHIEI